MSFIIFCHSYYISIVYLFFCLRYPSLLQCKIITARSLFAFVLAIWSYIGISRLGSPFSLGTFLYLQQARLPLAIIKITGHEWRQVQGTCCGESTMWLPGAAT